jgi:hypothetical protein
VADGCVRPYTSISSLQQVPGFFVLFVLRRVLCGVRRMSGLCVRGADGEDVPGVGGNDVGGDEVDLVGGIGVALGAEVTSVGASAKEEGAFDLDADSDCEQAALLRPSGAGHDFCPPPMACAMGCTLSLLSGLAPPFRTTPNGLRRGLHFFRSFGAWDYFATGCLCMCIRGPIPNLGSYFCCCFAVVTSVTAFAFIPS